MIFETLPLPYSYLVIASVILIGIFIFSRMDSGNVLMYGFYLFIAWLLFGAFRGVPESIEWMYYLHFTLSMLAGYVLWIVLMFICEKWGEPYMGDGGLGALAPLVMFIPVTGFALVVKLGVIYIF